MRRSWLFLTGLCLTTLPLLACQSPRALHPHAPKQAPKQAPKRLQQFLQAPTAQDLEEALEWASEPRWLAQPESLTQLTRAIDTALGQPPHEALKPALKPEHPGFLAALLVLARWRSAEAERLVIDSFRDARRPLAERWLCLEACAGWSKRRYSAHHELLFESLVALFDEARNERLRAAAIKLATRAHSIFSESERESLHIILLGLLKTEQGPALGAAYEWAGVTDSAAIRALVLSQHDNWFQPARRRLACVALGAWLPRPEAERALLERSEDWAEAVRVQALRALMQSPKLRRAAALKALDEEQSLALESIAVIDSQVTAFEAERVAVRFATTPPEQRRDQRRVLNWLSQHGPIKNWGPFFYWPEFQAKDFEAFYTCAYLGYEERAFFAQALGHPRLSVRKRALTQVLSLTGDRTGFRPHEQEAVAIQALKREVDADILEAALNCLSPLADLESVREALVQAAEDLFSPRLRRQALRALSQFKDSVLFEAAKDSLENADKEQRQLAKEILARQFPEWWQRRG